MNASDALDSLIYISLKNHVALAAQFPGLNGDIPLPVRKTAAADPFSPEDLTSEAILSGILTVLAYDAHSAHVGYYRDLLEKVRPSIRQELCEAAVFKARNEDFGAAEELFAALRGIDPDDVSAVLNTALFYDEWAESYRRSGLHEDADACDAAADSYYRKAMAADPPAADAFFNAAFFFLKQKLFSRAKDCFETYLSLTDTADESQLEENERYKRSRAREAASDISSRNLEDGHFKAAFDFISAGQEERGLEHIRLFLEKNPQVWNAWFLLGWGLRRLERWADARASFEKAVQLGGVSADACNELAICCMELGDLSAVGAYLKQALSLEPENTKIISNLGYLAVKEGRPDEAAGFFRTVLEIDPDDKIAAFELKKL